MKIHTNKGFTLVEMAIVLVVIGILVGMGVGLIGPLTTMNKVRESREVVEADISSVVSWAASNNRLPNAYAEFQTVISRSNDAWGQAAYYFYDPLLTAGNICGRRTTNLTICKTAACAVADRTTNIAFAVISGGSNYNPQTGIIPCPGGVPGVCIGVFEPDTTTIDNCTDALNCPDLNIPGTFQRFNRPESYDDIVRWVTLDELRSKIGCQGAQLKIVNNELPATSLGNTYSVNIFADGGVPYVYSPPSPAPSQNQYRWCVEINSRQAALGLPNGVTFTPNFIRYPDDTSAPTRCIDQAESSGWLPWATNLVITKSINSTDTGSFSMTVYARDNQETGNSPACNSATPGDNCTQKTFVLTVSP